jgi:signal transduction histidine kinase
MRDSDIGANGAKKEAVAPDFLAGGGEMGARMRVTDWSTTSLGPVESWPQSLRSAVSICIGSSFPICIYWGRELALLYNDAWSPIPGSKHPWALGRPAREVWPEIWDTIGPMFERVIATGVATRSEDQLLPMRRHGYTEECYFDYTFSPIRSEDGAVGGIFNAVVETTYRVIGERRTRVLRELGERIAAARSAEETCALAASTLAAAPADLPFCLLYLLDEAVAGAGRRARLAGAAGLAPGGPASPALIDVADAAGPWPLAWVLETGRVVRVDALGERFGSALPGGPWPEPAESALVAPIVGTLAGGGDVSGFLVAGVSPRRALDDEYLAFVERTAAQIAAVISNARAYETERKRAEALAEIDRAKTAFFSNVSHEFRTPLTLMLGPLEEALAKLPADGGSAGERALVDTAHRNGLRLLKLVNSLLDFSRIEAGRVEANYEPTDLAAFTADLASNFRSAVDRAGLRLVIDCPPLREPVYVDRDMWEKVVLNLLSNAFKFTFEGEIAVAVRPSADGSAAELIVRDTGTGIPEHELPRLFERFHRVEGAKGRTFEGSGIGLALVQELVRLHGGAIRADSQFGCGSTFTVTVPLGGSHLPADRIRGERTRVSTGIRAQAYVEEALRWLPQGVAEGAGGASGGVPGADADADDVAAALSRSAADDLGMPLPAAAAGAAGARVLLADDNADMRDYVCRLLVDQGYEVEAVPDGEAALAAARRRAPDLVLSDVMMPGLDGFGLLRALRADPALRELPVLLLSARAGEEARVEGMDAGADDYLTKPFSARELLARVGANLQMARLRRDAMEALRARTAELETVLETVPAAVWFTYDREARHITGNRHATALLRLPAHASPSLSAPEHRRPTSFRVFRNGVESRSSDLPLQRAARGEEVRNEEWEVRFVDGGSITVLMHATPLRDEARRVVGAVAAGIDITARKQAETVLRDLNAALEERVVAEMNRREQLEADLRQAQKMEAIGQLTGGVAHDMNNLLLVIQGNLEVLDRHFSQAAAASPGDRLSRSVQAALRGVDRAAALTYRLLAFARRQPLDPKPLEPNRLVSGMSDLLRRTLGEAVAIETVLAGGLWRTFADPNQLENAILNLAVNGRDAMPGGGKLTIETANAHLDETYADLHHDVSPGQYVMIAVTDTGMGMSRDAVEKAFEPFFTTKEAGKGTGLGLSQVYGFVKQSGGHVKIYSEPGDGTTVKIYLPRYLAEDDEASAAAAAAAATAPAVPTGTPDETILVVEDDDDVRASSVFSLRELGYRVVEAPTGAAALQLLDGDATVRLLFTDVGLPGGMNGRQLADEARRRRPDLRVLFTTGYARNAIVHHGRLDPGVALLVKPYTFAALAGKIRQVMEADGGD